MGRLVKKSKPGDLPITILGTTGNSRDLESIYNQIMNFRKTGILFLFLSAPLWSQTNSSIKDSLNTQTLDEVVVIDSRFPLKRSQSGRVVEKIDAQEIDRFQGLDLSELLRTRAGIDILGSRSQLGQNLTTSIRGGRNDQVLILIDGVRVNDPSRIGTDFDLNFLPLEAIESIEILKGAAGTLYGSAASAGVINITTKKGQQDSQLSWSSSFGTLQSQETIKEGITALENSLRYSDVFGNTGVNLFYSQRYADGMSAVAGGENNLFARNNFGFNLGQQFSDNYTVRVSANKDFSRSEYDGFDASFSPADANNLLISDQWRFALQQNLQYTKGELQLDLGYQTTERDFQSDFPVFYESTNFTLDLSNRYVFSDLLYSIIGYFSQQNTANIVDEEKSTQHDLYANLIYSINGFNLNIGSRWNSHDIYGSHLTYNLNPSFNFQFTKQRSVKFLVNIGTGFNTPSLYQLYDLYSGNTDLEPEESQTREVGLDYLFPTGNFSVVYFEREENPTLIYDFNTYRYGNSVAEVQYSGFEFRYSNRIGDALQWNANYTLTETEGGDLRRIPKHAYRIGIDYDFSSRLALSGAFSRTGERIAVDGMTTLEAYSLVDIRAQYRLKKPNMTLFLNLTNALNEDYIEFVNYSSRGRNLMAGFRWER